MTVLVDVRLVDVRVVEVVKTVTAVGGKAVMKTVSRVKIWSYYFISIFNRPDVAGAVLQTAS